MTRTALTAFFSRAVVFLYAVFFLSVFCGFRLLNSVTLATLTGLGLLLIIVKIFSPRRKDVFNLFVAGCLLFYLVQLAGLLYTHNLRTGIRQMELKLTLVLIPLMLCPPAYPDPAFRKTVMPWYIFILAGVMIYCLSIALVTFLHTRDASVFFYHALVKPFLNHAIQSSILVFVALVYLLECCRTKSFLINKPFHLFLIAFFVATLVLLSSKLVIIFSFVSSLVYLGILTRTNALPKKRIRLYLAVSSLLLLIVIFTDNPVSTRFKDLANGSLRKIEQPSFVQGDYFNGIQFRLLQWKFVTEILTRQHAWLYGVSPGDGQSTLDAKYIEVNMYIGDGLKNRGFLGYNTHNQLLESVLQSGIAGVLAFLLIIAGLVQLMIRRNQAELWLTGILLLAYSFQDAVFQTQFGGTLFIFFPLFLYYGSVSLPRSGTKNTDPGH